MIRIVSMNLEICAVEIVQTVVWLWTARNTEEGAGNLEGLLSLGLQRRPPNI